VPLVSSPLALHIWFSLLWQESLLLQQLQLEWLAQVGSVGEQFVGKVSTPELC
jgi:hypothetical protein